jgi:hypothetical protein
MRRFNSNRHRHHSWIEKRLKVRGGRARQVFARDQPHIFPGRSSTLGLRTQSRCSASPDISQKTAGILLYLGKLVTS